MKACVVSGSFDPVTIGHMDIIRRAKEIFDRVYVVMLINPEKSYFFSLDQRMAMLRAAAGKIAIVDFYDGYTVDYCQSKGVKHIVRGIRDVESYPYENRINEINMSINPEISTVYFPSDPKLKEISSTLIRDTLSKGGDLSAYVPEEILKMIGEYYGKH